MGRTRPKCTGQAQPSPCEQCPQLFTCYLNSGRDEGSTQEKNKRGEGLTCSVVVVSGAARGDKQRRQQFVVAGGVVEAPPCFPSSFFSIFLLVFVFLLSSFLCFSSLSCFVFLVLFSFCCLLLALSSPTFIGEKQRRVRPERLLCCHPEPPKGYIPSILPPRGKQVGCVGVFLSHWGREVGENQGRKCFFFPCSLHVQGKKKTYGVVLNDTVLGLF